MQRRIWLLFVTLMIVSALLLSACGGYGRERTESGQVAAPSTAAPAAGAAGTTTEQPAQPAGPVKLKLGETGDLGGAKITVTGVKTTFSPLGEGRVQVFVDMRVENPTETNVSIAGLSWFKIRDPQGNTAPINGAANAAVEMGIEGSAPPGETREGSAGFDVTMQEGEWALEVRRPGIDGVLEWSFTLPEPVEY